jgi:hypothetical protein
MPRFSLDSAITKDSAQVLDRVVDGEALLIHLPSGEYYSLDSVGTLIWENIDGSRSIEDLAELVLDEYDVDREKVVADVLRLIEQLAGEGLLLAQ